MYNGRPVRQLYYKPRINLKTKLFHSILDRCHHLQFIGSNKYRIEKELFVVLTKIISSKK